MAGRWIDSEAFPTCKHSQYPTGTRVPLPLPRYSIIILIIPCLDTRCLDIRVESWPRRWIYASPSN